MRTLLLLPLCLIIYFNTFASYKVVGWHWYNEPGTGKNIQIHDSSLDTQQEPDQDVDVDIKKTGSQKLELLRHTIKDSLATAILEPTERNVLKYLILQNYLIKQVANFSKSWQKTLLDYPGLDYSIQHPSQGNAQHLVEIKKRNNEQMVIDKYSKQYGIFFFYRGESQLDIMLYQSIQAFAEENHISWIPISVDGAYYEKKILNNGQAEEMGIKYFPAMVLVDPKARKYIPFAYGFMSQEEIRRRFLDIATNFNNQSGE